MINPKLSLYVFKIRLFFIEMNYVIAHVYLVLNILLFTEMIISYWVCFLSLWTFQYCLISIAIKIFLMSREMFVYNFTMSNLVSVFPHALRHRIREKRIVIKIKFSLRVFLIICLIFYRFQPGVPYKSVAYKKKACIL